jgi:hypothetical protein
MRWDVDEIRTYDGRTVRFVKTCRHDEPVQVLAAVSGELVAHLCPDCDRQLPAEWSA